MNQFIGTVVTSAVVAFVCTHTKFGKMTFSAVDEAIEHFAQLRERIRQKRREDRRRGREREVDVEPEDVKPCEEK